MQVSLILKSSEFHILPLCHISWPAQSKLLRLTHLEAQSVKNRPEAIICLSHDAKMTDNFYFLPGTIIMLTDIFCSCFYLCLFVFYQPYWYFQLRVVATKIVSFNYCVPLVLRNSDFRLGKINKSRTFHSEILIYFAILSIWPLLTLNLTKYKWCLHMESIKTIFARVTTTITTCALPYCNPDLANRSDVMPNRSSDIRPP